MELLHDIYVRLGDISVLFLAINVVICFFNFKKLPTSFKWLSYFLIWALLIEISARICSYTGHNNLPLLHLYTFGEFVLLSLFYKKILSNLRFFKGKFWLFILIGMVLIVLNSCFNESIYGFNSVAKTGVQVIIIIFAVTFFYASAGNPFAQPSLEKSLRLVNSAIIVYYSGSLFIFMCNQLFIDQEEAYKMFWAFNAFLNLVFQALILWALWKIASSKTPLSS